MTPPRKQYVLVGNPTARSGQGLDRIDTALASMRRRGVLARFLPTRPDGLTVPAVRDAIDAGDVDVVISLGGDGTFAEVAKGVLAAERRVSMAFLPSGTANDQGRSFGISTAPEAIEENLDIVLNEHLVHLDVGRIARFDERGRIASRDLFFDSAGFGLQPDILSRRNRDRAMVGQIPLLRSLYRNQAVFAGATFTEVLRTIVEPVKFTAEVTTARGDRVVFSNLTDLVVNATPVYGGWWVPTRHTEPDDGVFELFAIAGRRDMLATTLRGIKDLPLPIPDLDLLGAPPVRELDGDYFDVELLRPRGEGRIKSQIDGEEWEPGTRFQVQVWRNALPLIVREGWIPPWRTQSG